MFPLSIFRVSNGGSGQSTHHRFGSGSEDSGAVTPKVVS